MDVFHSIVDYLNANPPVVITGLGVIAVVLQYLVKKVAAFGKLANYVLALGAIPGLITAVAAFGTSLHLNAYPWVVIVGQATYAGYEWLKANTREQVLAELTPEDPHETTTASAEVLPTPVHDNTDLPISLG